MRKRDWLYALLAVGIFVGIGILQIKSEIPPTTTPDIFADSQPPTTIQIWFNHESQQKAIEKQGKHDFYDLVFFFSSDTGKAAENSGRLVKCRLDGDFVEGYITKSYMGELTIPIKLCEELKP